MEDSLRSQIIRNVDVLIGCTEYNPLIEACVKHNILSRQMRVGIEQLEPTSQQHSNENVQNEWHKRLFIKLTKRGPDAYRQLIKVMAELKYVKAYQLLNIPLDDESQFKSLNGNSKDNRNTKESQQHSQQPSQQPLQAINENNSNSSSSSLDTGNTNANDGVCLSRQTNNDDEVLPELKLYTDKPEPSNMFVVTKSTELHKDENVGHYPMFTKNNRGVFFMVNIIDFRNADDKRNGADEDAKALLHLFKEFNFKCFAYTNLTLVAFNHLLKKVIDSDYARDAECFVMALMTHGNMLDNSVEMVEFHDGSVAKVHDIESYFQNSLAPNLLHKPKILIFPFCRGDVSDMGHYQSQIQTDSIAHKLPTINNIPSLSDMLICYASIRGFKSHRDKSEGSWYIQKFCELMAKHGHNLSFETILKKIQVEAGKYRTNEGAMQTGSYINNGFNKSLYFNPGYWEEEKKEVEYEGRLKI